MAIPWPQRIHSPIGVGREMLSAASAIDRNIIRQYDALNNRRRTQGDERIGYEVWNFHKCITCLTKYIYLTFLVATSLGQSMYTQPLNPSSTQPLPHTYGDRIRQ